MNSILDYVTLTEGLNGVLSALLPMASFLLRVVLIVLGIIVLVRCGRSLFAEMGTQ